MVARRVTGASTKRAGRSVLTEKRHEVDVEEPVPQRDHRVCQSVGRQPVHPAADDGRPQSGPGVGQRSLEIKGLTAMGAAAFDRNDRRETARPCCGNVVVACCGNGPARAYACACGRRGEEGEDLAHLHPHVKRDGDRRAHHQLPGTTRAQSSWRTRWKIWCDVGNTCW